MPGFGHTARLEQHVKNLEERKERLYTLLRSTLSKVQRYTNEEATIAFNKVHGEVVSLLRHVQGAELVIPSPVKNNLNVCVQMDGGGRNKEAYCFYPDDSYEAVPWDTTSGLVQEIRDIDYSIDEFHLRIQRENRELTDRQLDERIVELRRKYND